MKRYQKAFELLAPQQQDKVLKGLESGTVELESLSSKLFFGLLMRNTMEGFFRDPIYGGHRDKVGNLNGELEQLGRDVVGGAQSPDPQL